ncbi:hypothetical protein E2C01_035441 [Portunus trituberculatus]|uniref:Uncharacterized protein n=1 Tax=Portunus trituberculatus TaxID=210409 RepID=A0A5B7FBG9_PORTR|nr:hypothetical protein [Portunus trituberculatus]
MNQNNTQNINKPLSSHTSPPPPQHSPLIHKHSAALMSRARSLWDTLASPSGLTDDTALATLDTALHKITQLAKLDTALVNLETQRLSI